MDEHFVRAVLAGSFGSFLEELLHWNGLKTKLDSRRYRRMLASPVYWAITLAMIVSAGIGTWAWFEGHEAVPLRTLIVFGFAFPLVIKKAGASLFGGPSEDKLAPAVKRLNPARSVVRDYFELPSDEADQ